MTIGKKISKESDPTFQKKVSEGEMSKVIDRNEEGVIGEITEPMIRFTLRLPIELADRLDEMRSSRVGSVSRNQWILEAIAEKLGSKQQGN